VYDIPELGVPIRISLFTTLYRIITHSKLKDILKEFIQLCLKKKNVQRGYKYLVLGRDKSYFVKKKPNKNHSDSPKRFLETDIIKMLEFWNDNTFVSLLVLSG
jgi:hypothetical protein